MEPADEYFEDEEEEQTAKPLYFFDLIKKDSEEASVWSSLNIHPLGLTAWTCDSVEAMSLKLVRSLDDLQDDDLNFKPQMTYQVFGEKELIVGYKNLEVNLTYGAGSLRTLVDVKYSDKVDSSLFDAEDIEGKLKDYLQAGYHTSVDNFSIGFEEEEQNFKPPGKLLRKFTIDSEEGERTFDVYFANVVDNPKVTSFCERMQTFMLWYIEAASFIEYDDPKWKFFFLFEKFENNGKQRFAFAGFVSTYEFYCYPDNIRPRVSQMLIIPTFQSSGLGAKLLNEVFLYYRTDNKVTDVSVESPSVEFQRLRDYVDCLSCMELPVYASLKADSSFTKEMEAAAKTQLKMSKKQAHRVFNILRLKVCDQLNEGQVEKYLESLKQQADKQNQRILERAEKRGLMTAMKREDLVDAIPSLSAEYRLSAITQVANNLYENFVKVVDRLNS